MTMHYLLPNPDYHAVPRTLTVTGGARRGIIFNKKGFLQS
jgi:hypothetical protein